MVPDTPVGLSSLDKPGTRNCTPRKPRMSTHLSILRRSIRHVSPYQQSNTNQHSSLRKRWSSSTSSRISSGELGALPLALQAASRPALVFRRCRSRRPDRVCRGTKLVGRHMAHRRGLAGSVRGMPCCPTQVSGRGVGMAGRRAGLCPRDLTPRPGTPEVDRPTWTVVVRPCLLEVVQHVLRAVRRPHREKTMIVVLEGPAATHGDEPRIPDLGEDHQLPISLLCPPRVAGSASDEPAAPMTNH